jgi:hypothetical protein
MANKSRSKYIVGHGKPPKHAQFKPGQSGNPRGRPRNTSSFDDDIETELCSSITVLEGGERKRITKRRAIAKQHVNRALNGDVRSTELLFKIRERQPSEQQDNVGALLEEFREKNRRISAKRTQTNDTSTRDDEE